MTRKTTFASLFTIPVLAISMLLCGRCGGDVDHTVSTDERSPQSIIVLAVAGLRADALGCYGGHGSTPSLDALAGESVRFDSAWAQAPGMRASLASLLTGLYPTTHGLVNTGDRLVPEANTLAEQLSTAGLATGAFLQGPEGEDDFGLAQGFAEYTVTPRPGQAGLAWMGQHAEEDVFLLVGGWSAGNLESPDADTNLKAPEGCVNPGNNFRV
ncbi:MAG: sulfatase-like hydrolase/transferase [Acidobacteriota bacterium]